MSGQYRYNTGLATYLENPMNRKKKIKQILTKKAKKANSKLAPKSTKPRYISKAERAELAANESSEIQSDAT
ncbi:hypothetical protein MED92_14598 [Oceanospirillum sp. MED92]|uniref:DUF2986 domain-containing protein n=2 Tax=Neptuniibacter caesariensis TaxID=207954 RepID=A0A7U8GTL8_NEPCE|nr:hypothetical protein MED92_14598 [Oceanospirillum sp. MED92] [Neptuniibacter caesariensis]